MRYEEKMVRRGTFQNKISLIKNQIDKRESLCLPELSLPSLIKVRGRDEGGEGSEQGKAGHLGGGRIWAVGRAPDGNGARWAWPPAAASLPPQSRLGYLGRRDCE